MRKNYRLYFAVLFPIILIAIALRFWNFQHRLILFSDSARDSLLGLEAVRYHKLPLTGSFSSAGPFVFGPVFYYFIMFFYALLQQFIFGPWYGVALLSTLLVVILATCAMKIGGRLAGIITALLTAVSPAQVFRSAALTQHSLVGISTGLVLLMTIYYAKNKKTSWAFLLGVFAGIAASLHYQAIALLFIGAIVLIVQHGVWRRIRDSIAYFFGVILPFAPLLYWDYQQQFANLRNLLDYVLIGQYRIFVSRRWLTFITTFIPETWGGVIGGNRIFGILLIFLVAYTCIGLVRKKRFPFVLLWILIMLTVQLITMRYYHGELFEGYLIVLHPFILFLSGLGISESIRQKSWGVISVVFLFTIVVNSLRSDFAILAWDKNTVVPVEQTIGKIKNSLGNQMVLPYDAQYNSSEFSYALSYMLEQKQMISEKGIPVGVCLWMCPEEQTEQKIDRVRYMDREYDIVKISDSPNESIDSKFWINVSAKNTLKEVGFWWKEKPLRSNFSLQLYIRNFWVERFKTR